MCVCVRKGNGNKKKQSRERDKGRGGRNSRICFWSRALTTPSTPHSWQFAILDFCISIIALLLQLSSNTPSEFDGEESTIVCCWPCAFVPSKTSFGLLMAKPPASCGKQSCLFDNGVFVVGSHVDVVTSQFTRGASIISLVEGFKNLFGGCLTFFNGGE